MRKITIILFFVLQNHIFSQNITISGVVTDENNKPMAGVTILVDNKPNTISNFDGYYRLLATDTSTITFSFIGYKIYAIIPAGITNIDVQMKPDIIELFEYCTVPRLFINAGLLLNTNGLYGGTITFKKMHAYCGGYNSTINGNIDYKSDYQNRYSFSSSFGLSDLKYFKTKKFGISAEYDQIQSDNTFIRDVKGKLTQQNLFKKLSVSERIGYIQYDKENSMGFGMDINYYLSFRKLKADITFYSGIIKWEKYEEYTIQTIFSKNIHSQNKGIIRMNLGLDYRNIKNYSELSILLRFDFLVKTITYI
jgi:hypothetical protein